MKVLVTGGAGFVGSTLALALKRDDPASEVIALDNLVRAGSALNVPRLKQGGVTFVKGDVRHIHDLAAIGPVDWLIECSAEASVHAGYDGDPSYLIDTNLLGAINCLEHLRRHRGRMIFLSTSRVYPMATLRALPLERRGDRFSLADGASGRGWSMRGIAEDFPFEGPRSLYGATKLSAELLITEYGAMYDVPALALRCGVLTGPWQMGKVDQGFVALWLARHVYGGPLRYIGYGGEGLQVRDILHAVDLYELILIMMSQPDRYVGQVFNVGGGATHTISLRELTSLCRATTGREMDIGADSLTRAADVPWFVTDAARLIGLSGWTPRRSVAQIVDDIHRWLIDHRSMLEPVFAL